MKNHKNSDFYNYCLNHSVVLLSHEREENKKIDLTFLKSDDVVKQNLLFLRENVPTTVNLYDVLYEVDLFYREMNETTTTEFEYVVAKQFLRCNDLNCEDSNLLTDFNINSTIMVYNELHNTNMDTLDIILPYMMLTDSDYQKQYKNISLTTENLTNYCYYVLNNMEKLIKVLEDDLPTILEYVHFSIKEDTKLVTENEKFPILLAVVSDHILNNTSTEKQLTWYDFIDKLIVVETKMKSNKKVVTTEDVTAHYNLLKKEII